MTKKFATGEDIIQAMIKAGLTYDQISVLTGILPRRLIALSEMPFIPETSRDDYDLLSNILELPELPLFTSNNHDLALFDTNGNGTLYRQESPDKPFKKITLIHIRTFFDKVLADAAKPLEPFSELTISTDQKILETSDPYYAGQTFRIYMPTKLDDAAMFRRGAWGCIERSNPKPMGGFEFIIQEIREALEALKHFPNEVLTAHITQLTSLQDLFPPEPAAKLTDEQIAEKKSHDERRSEVIRLRNAKKRRNERKGKRHAA